MSTCFTCGGPFRKGRRLHVPLRGELVVRLVCGRCAKRALKIVPIERPTLCASCPSTNANEARVCPACANEMAHRAAALVLKPFVERIRGQAKAFRLNADPLHLGLSMAADILDCDLTIPMRAAQQAAKKEGRDDV